MDGIHALPGLHLAGGGGGGGGCPPWKLCAPHPLGNFNFSKFNTVHYTRPPNVFRHAFVPIFLNEPLTSAGINGFCVMLFFFRLSLKREPDGVVVRKYKDPSGPLRCQVSAPYLKEPRGPPDPIHFLFYGLHLQFDLWDPFRF